MKSNLTPLVGADYRYFVGFVGQHPQFGLIFDNAFVERDLPITGPEGPEGWKQLQIEIAQGLGLQNCTLINIERLEQPKLLKATTVIQQLHKGGN